MSDQLINALPTITDAQADDNTRLIPSGLASTGKLYKMTVAQAKKVYSTQKVKYVTTGAEGSTLTIAALAGRTILLVTREAAIVHEVVSPTAPVSGEYSFDSTSISLGDAVNPIGGERFTILWKNA